MDTLHSGTKFYGDSGTPINNELDDLKSLILLLVKQRKSNFKIKQALDRFPKWKKKIPELSEMDFEFVIQRKKADVEDQFKDRIPGATTTIIIMLFT